jgi:hypothetical protein
MIPRFWGNGIENGVLKLVQVKHVRSQEYSNVRRVSLYDWRIEIKRLYGNGDLLYLTK